MNKEYRVAVTFELYTEDGEEKAMTGFVRPQDFRVKEAHWQYYQTFISAPNAAYEVHAYARRWQGPGKDHAELEHDQHPTTEQIADLVLEVANGMGGFPIGLDQNEQPVGPNDPLDEDDMLDPSDDPDDFAYLDDDQEDLFYGLDLDERDKTEQLPDWFSAPDVTHPAGKMLACPSCGQPMAFKGVWQVGNVLTREPFHWAGRWQCNPCRALVSDDDIDQAWAAAQWTRQQGQDQ